MVNNLKELIAKFHTPDDLTLIFKKPPDDLDKAKLSIEEDLENIQWSALIINYDVSEAFLDKYGSYLNWGLAVKYQKLSEEFIENHIHYLNLDMLLLCQNLSPEFIEKHKSKFLL